MFKPTGTTPGHRFRAEANTFATMAYIVAVNPLILADDSEATGCASWNGERIQKGE